MTADQPQHQPTVSADEREALDATLRSGEQAWLADPTPDASLYPHLRDTLLSAGYRRRSPARSGDDRLRAAITDYADKIDAWLAPGGVNPVNPFGPLHGAGMAFAYKETGEILRAALRDSGERP